jgi:hypothetical protein
MEKKNTDKNGWKDPNLKDRTKNTISWVVKQWLRCLKIILNWYGVGAGRVLSKLSFCGNVNLTYEQNCIIFKCFWFLLNVQKDHITGITGLKLGEHAHHMNLS